MYYIKILQKNIIEYYLQKSYYREIISRLKYI